MKTLPRQLRFIILLLIIWFALSETIPALAQSNTTVPNRPLPFNKTVSGQLRGKSEKVIYAFDVPVDQDVVVEYRANKLVFHGSCFWIGTAQPDDNHCQYEGGSGGDRTSYSYILISTLGKQDQHATITLTRVLDGASTYQITAYTITPQAITLDQTASFTPTDAQPFQVYTLDSDNTVPFTIEAEDNGVDDNFLWAAYLPFSYKNFPVINKETVLPNYIDGAVSDNGARGIEDLRLFYLVGNTFRVVIKSVQSYTLNTANAMLPTLSKNESAAVTISYRQPLRVIPLDAQAGELTQVNFELTSGTAALGAVYEMGNPVGKARKLGSTTRDEQVYPKSNNIQMTAINALYVVVQIPYEFTRDTVTIKVNWQKLT